MAEGIRGTNGKFVKQPGGEPQQSGEIVTGLAPKDANGHAGTDKVVIDTAAIDARADSDRRSGEGKRGPGRPKGSGQKEKEARPQGQGRLDLDSFNFTLFFAHSTLAKATKTPELALDEIECKNMATACLNVMQHYNIKASQKAIDWGNLLLTCGLIYGGKMSSISQRKDEERKSKKAAQESNFAGGISGV